MSITPENFSYICQLLKQHSAIALDDNKQYLVISRLLPIARRGKLDGVNALIEKLRAVPSANLIQQVVDAMTTNETSFFRDTGPFELLADRVLPELIKRRSRMRTLNVWSAGCASGQEPYTLAMLWHERFPQLENWRLNLFATDISEEMLSRAREGRYSTLEVNRGLSNTLLKKYFHPHGDHWVIDERLRKMIKFMPLNLSAAWPVLPQMDLILLRNVMVYFEVSTKKEILGKVRGLLRPDGYLLLGGAETTLTIDDEFERIATPAGSYYSIKTKPAGTVSSSGASE